MWPLVLSILLLLLHLAMGWKKPIVWLAWCLNDCLWIVYSVASRQTGFLVSAVPMLGIHGLNWYRWTRASPVHNDNFAYRLTKIH